MKTLFEFNTPYGDKYLVLENGDIARTDMPFTPSGQWKFLGIESVKSSNYFIPLSKLTKELVASLPLLYKNGNPKFTVRDLDHGSTRVWGNTKYHGIRSIYFK